MRIERSIRRPALRRMGPTLLALLVLGACSSANPSNRETLKHPLDSSGTPAAAPASWPLGGGATPPPIIGSTPTVQGVTSDPGTRYLSMGSVGALTVETPPAPPPARP